MKAFSVPTLFGCCLLFSDCSDSVNALSKCDTSPRQKVVMTYTDAKATLRKDPTSSNCYIEIIQCNCQKISAFPKGLTAPAVVCNLPSKYQKEGSIILFSGQLRVDTTYNYEVIDLPGVPLELTKIHVIE